MRKTSVYLPEGMKTALRDVAARWDRSEAQLIRDAIDRLVRSAAAEAAPGEQAVPARVRGPLLVGVGVGPGAPDLVTQRAVRVLEEADRVFAPSTAPDAIGRAEAVVRASVPGIGIDRLPVTMTDDAGSREKCLDGAAGALVEVLDRAQVAAIVTIGDPNVFSIFSELARRVAVRRPGVPIRAIPGIMAFQELAACVGSVVAEGDEHVEIATAGEDIGALDAALDDPGRTVVLYKGGRHLPELAAHLEARGRLDGAVVGELLGLPGGRGGPVREMSDRSASYLATVVVPAVRDGQP